MFEPENEMGVIVYFAMNSDAFGLEVISIGQKFPDAIIRDKLTGKEYRTEFEFASSNFVAHGHDPRVCDFIICWIHDYDNCLLPVLELSNSDGFFLIDVSDVQREVMYLRIQNIRLKRQLDRTQSELMYQEMKTSKKQSIPKKTDGTYFPPAGSGWRIERNGKGIYFAWRRGSGNNRESIYGGKFELLSD